MSLTVEAPLSVAEARRRLSNTRRLSAAEIDDLERIIARFHASRPRRPCAACGSMIWGEHSTAAGEPTWSCQGCHRSANLTADDWHAQREQAKREAAAVTAVPEPAPREQLAAALARRAEATAVLARLDAALPAARTAVLAAQARLDTARAATTSAEQSAVERLAASLTGDAAPSAGVTSGAARGLVRTAEDALHAARGARGLLEDQHHYAEKAVTSAAAVVHSAALHVLVEDELETVLSAAVAARAAYLTGIQVLAWFLTQHAVPNGDVRPSQLVNEADTPPALWPKAPHAEERLAARLAELEAGSTP
jgi:hypothetical protein